MFENEARKRRPFPFPFLSLSLPRHRHRRRVAGSGRFFAPFPRWANVRLLFALPTLINRGAAVDSPHSHAGTTLKRQLG